MFLAPDYLVIYYLFTYYFYSTYFYFLIVKKKRFFCQFPSEVVVHYSANLWFNELYSNSSSDLLSSYSERTWRKAPAWFMSSKARWSLCAQRIWHLTYSLDPGQPNQVRLELQGRLQCYMACRPSCAAVWLILANSKYKSFGQSLVCPNRTLL